MNRFLLIALPFIAIPAAIAQFDKPTVLKKELPELLALRTPYEAMLKAVAADRDKKLANLDYIYMRNLDELQKDRTAAGDLRGALAAKAELDRLGARQETTDEQRKAMSPPLQKLRASYDAALKFYLAEAAKGEGALLQKLIADLDSMQRRITTTGDLEKALVVLTEKERIEAEAAKARPALISPTVVNTPVTPVPVPKVQSSRETSVATKTQPFENTLGMKFVPVNDTKVLFCIHKTRRQDYAAFAAEVTPADSSWKNCGANGISVGREDNHPVANVSWDNAKKFCEWLSKKEGKTYRLPTDKEWSYAVGIANSEKWGNTATPQSRNSKVDGYPWGKKYPPKAGELVGNYADLTLVAQAPGSPHIDGYTDGFVGTSPVMSFPPNQFGLYDMGGNLLEWVEDWWNAEKVEHVLRGSYFLSHGLEILSSRRSLYTGGIAWWRAAGFRVVLERP